MDFQKATAYEGELPLATWNFPLALVIEIDMVIMIHIPI